jgi:tight adherence protein B
VSGPHGVRDAALWSAALCLVAAAAWLVQARDDTVRRARLMFADGCLTGAVPPPGVARWREHGRRGAAALKRCWARLEDRLGMLIGREALCVPAGVVLAWAVRSPVPALAGVLAAVFSGRWLRARRRRSRLERWQEAVSALCSEVAGELRAGRPPDAALAEVAGRLRGPAGPGGAPDPAAAQSMARLVAAARFGGDVPGALRQAARVPGAEGMAGVAACWEVAVDHGAGLADGLDQVAAALRAERDQQEDLRAQLAGPRSTAAMLALLPVFGVGLGAALGADPLRVLLRTPLGLACLLVGGVLEGAGLLWTNRIVRAAEEAG